MPHPHSLRLLRLAAGLLCLPAAAAQACDTAPYIGSICITANPYCPAGYLPAEGALLPIQQNTALFALLGTNFGGDGKTTFALPDLRGRIPVGVGQGSGLREAYLGERLGQESVALTTNHLPAHTHAASVSMDASKMQVTVNVSTGTSGNAVAPSATHKYLAGSPNGPGAAAIWASGASAPVTLGGVSVSGGTVTVSNSSGGTNTVIPTVPPVLVLRYCIARDGVFPSRPD